eukprot:3628382-Ditylum_brightwellii.AAC.1
MLSTQEEPNPEGEEAQFVKGSNKSSSDEENCSKSSSEFSGSKSDNLTDKNQIATAYQHYNQGRRTKSLGTNAPSNARLGRLTKEN